MDNRDKQNRKIHYIGMGVIIAVMLATWYLPDLIYTAFSETEEMIAIYAYVFRIGLTYLCALGLVICYAINIIGMICKKRFPKDFWKPSKWVVRGVFAVIFGLLTAYFVMDTSNTIADINAEPVYIEYDVINVTNSASGTKFNVYDPEAANYDNALQYACYRIKDVEKMSSGRKYKFRVLQNTQQLIVVEDLGKTPNQTE